MSKITYSARFMRCLENDDFLLIIVEYKKKLTFLKKSEKKALPFSKSLVVTLIERQNDLILIN